MSLYKLWREVYGCGCSSNLAERKKHLLGYCPEHMELRSELYKGTTRKEL